MSDLVPYVQQRYFFDQKAICRDWVPNILETDLVARIRRRVRASPHSGHRFGLRCGHDLPSTFPKPQFRLSIRVRTPTFQNYLVSILQELEVLSAVKCHGLCPSFSGLVQAAQLELVTLFIYGLCVGSS